MSLTCLMPASRVHRCSQLGAIRLFMLHQPCCLRCPCGPRQLPRWCQSQCPLRAAWLPYSMNSQPGLPLEPRPGQLALPRRFKRRLPVHWRLLQLRFNAAEKHRSLCLGLLRRCLTRTPTRPATSVPSTHPGLHLAASPTLRRSGRSRAPRSTSPPLITLSRRALGLGRHWLSRCQMLTLPLCAPIRLAPRCLTPTLTSAGRAAPLFTADGLSDTFS